MRIKIRDFKKVETLQIDVEGLVGIIGPNGSGKSTIINALKSLIYNVAGDAVRWGAESAAVGVHLEEPVVWKRSGGAPSYIFRGKKYEKLGRVVPEEIARFLNMDPIAVEEEKHFVNFFQQLDAPLVVKLSPSRLYSLIVKSLDADKIEKASKNVEKFLLELKEELRELDSRELIYKQEKEKLERVILQTEEVDSWKESIANYEEHVDSLSRLKGLRGQYQDSKKAMTVLVELGKFQDRLDKGLAIAEKLMPEQTELDKLLDLKARYLPVDEKLFEQVSLMLSKLGALESPEEIEWDLSNLRRVKRTHLGSSGASRKLEDIAAVAIKLDSCLQDYPDGLNKVVQVQERLEFVRKSISDLTEIIGELEMLTTGKVCPTCGKDIEVDHEDSESL